MARRPTVKLYGNPDRYCLRWWREGRQFSVTLGRMAAAEAELARAKKQAELDGEILLGRAPAMSPTAAITVGALLQSYLDGLDGRAVGHQRNERARAAALTAALRGERLAALTTARLERYALERHRQGVSRETIWGELRLLQRAARKESKAELPPLPRPGLLPDDARPPRALTEQELQELIGAAMRLRPDFAGLLQFLAWCPCRPAEAMALTREDCARVLVPGLPRAQRQVRFRVTKGGEGRGYRPIAEPALDALRREMGKAGAAQGPVWTTASGAAWTPRHAGRVLARVAAEAGVPDVTLYDLRKLGVSRAYETLGNPRAVMRYTGHQKPETVLRYLQARPAEVDAQADSITWSSTPRPRALKAG